MPFFKPVVFCLLGLCSSTLALADGGRAVPLLPLAEKECSACHIAFRPNFLPKTSWQKVMTTLDKHYGADASLSPADQKEIADWLNTVALDAGEAPPDNRLTKAFWFTRKHGTKHIQPDVWRRASVNSPANCQACHVDAAKGDFNEHNIRIPR
jgi:hypothetical protein